MSKRNEELYGVQDINAYAARAMEQVDNTSTAMPELILEMIESASSAIPVAPTEAQQALNRIKFLITRHCPLYRMPEATPA